MEDHSVNLFCVALLLLAGLGSGEVIRTQKCYLPAAYQKSCTVHEVRVDPCPEAVNNKPCKVKLGANASLSFDFTPTFSASSMGSQVYKVNTLVDTPWDLMDTDGCKFTNCPVEANKKLVYTYAIEVGKQFPTEVHQLKWKLWSGVDHHFQCCFKFNIELIN